MITRAKNLLLSNIITTKATSQQSPCFTEPTDAVTQVQSRNKRRRKIWKKGKWQRTVTGIDVTTSSNPIGKTVEFNFDSTSNIMTSSQCQPLLPNELVTLILNHLDTQHDHETLSQCTLVSKRFYVMANPLLWQHVDFSIVGSGRFFYHMSHTSRQRLRTLAQYIQCITLDDTYGQYSDLLQLLPYTPHLEQLKICDPSTPYGDIIDEPDLDDNNNRRKLSSSSSSSSLDEEATNDVFDAISHSCPQLSHLEWQISKHFSVKYLAMLQHKCPLTTLKIDYTSPAATWGYRNLDAELVQIVKSFDMLTCLEINPYRISDGTRLLMDSTSSTTVCWPHLTRLSIRLCDETDEHTMIRFLQSHPHLEELRLDHIMNMTDTLVNTMATWLPKLTEVSLYGERHISNAAIRHLIQQCGHLKRLWIIGTQTPLVKQFPELAVTASHGIPICPFQLHEKDIRTIRKSTMEEMGMINNN